MNYAMETTVYISSQRSEKPVLLATLFIPFLSLEKQEVCDFKHESKNLFLS